MAIIIIIFSHLFITYFISNSMLYSKHLVVDIIQKTFLTKKNFDKINVFTLC